MHVASQGAGLKGGRLDPRAASPLGASAQMVDSVIGAITKAAPLGGSHTLYHGCLTPSGSVTFGDQQGWGFR